MTQFFKKKLILNGFSYKKNKTATQPSLKGVLNVNFRTPATHKMAPWVRTAFIDFLPRYLFIQRPDPDPATEETPELASGSTFFPFLNSLFLSFFFAFFHSFLSLISLSFNLLLSFFLSFFLSLLACLFLSSFLPFFPFFHSFILCFLISFLSFILYSLKF